MSVPQNTKDASRLSLLKSGIDLAIALITLVILILMLWHEFHLPIVAEPRGFDRNWSGVFVGLACFCLGLGVAYLGFADYRRRQMQKLRDEYTDLSSRARNLLVRMTRADTKPPFSDVR